MSQINIEPAGFKPMLACKCPPNMTMNQFLEQIRFPVLATPKIDGIRCMTLLSSDEETNTVCAVTRALKFIPNNHVKSMIGSHCPIGLDGELTCGSNFQAVTSGIMSHGGYPNFTYYIFGCSIHSNLVYREMLERLKEIKLPEFCSKLFPTLCNNLDELLAYEELVLSQGAEGVMTRPVNGMYKYGRSTLNEQYLLAIKRFEDAEAEIIDFEELMINRNPQVTNNLGLAERSSNAEGLERGGTLGALWVKDTLSGEEFKIGSGVGFTEQLRKKIWNNRGYYAGKTITYKYQKIGVKVKPRQPIFKGFRLD